MSSSLSCVSGNACASRTARYSSYSALENVLLQLLAASSCSSVKTFRLAMCSLEGDRVVRDCRQAVIEVPIPGHDVVKRFEEVEEGELEFFTEVLRSVLCEI